MGFADRTSRAAGQRACQVCGGCGVDDVGIWWSWVVCVAVRVQPERVVVRATRRCV